MIDEIWYEPVMPTAEEQRMINAAKRRIREKQRSQELPSGAAMVSTVLAVVFAIVILLSV